ncbi:hypothetical protein [Azospirillum brasilense]|nr:hypothetical protein [Azospirillum brasilense]
MLMRNVHLCVDFFRVLVRSLGAGVRLLRAPVGLVGFIVQLPSGVRSCLGNLSGTLHCSLQLRGLSVQFIISHGWTTGQSVAQALRQRLPQN